MDDFVFVFNEAGIFQNIYQPRSMEALNLPQEAYLGNSYQDIFTPEIVELIDTAIKAIITDGEVQQFDYPIAINGQEHWFSARVSPRRDSIGQFAGVTAVARDITKRKQMEKSLAKRTEELEAVNEDLKILSQMKDEFVSSVSHELRTPITNLKLYHSLLLLNPPKTEKYMSVLQRETERLEDIVEGLLSLSRLDQGQVRLNLETVDLNILAQQYSADRKALAKNMGLKLKLVCEPHLPTVTADKSLLGQALSILLTNAFNYTPEGGEVMIHTQTRHKDKCLWAGFTVRDSGSGVPIEEQPRLFERFFRGKGALEGSTPGTGLGLAIAKEIVGQHHGFIEAQSDGVPGMGAAFSIWLPVEIFSQAVTP
jgi:PAS domain S-box-containing protein